MPRAAEDLRRIAEYLYENAPHVEARVVHALFDSTVMAGEMPLLGRPTQRRGTRQVVVPDMPYLVTYRVSDSSVDILRIRHTSQRPLRI